MVQPYENHTEKNSLTRECIAKGFPKPITITWLLNSLPVTRHDITFSVLDEVDYVIVTSSIRINSVDKDDRGVFECFARNSVGNDSESTNFNVKCK